jgi:hypothetical protein
MRSFTLNKTYTVICESEDTRSGFRHVATLLKNGSEKASATKSYLNRTWERFTFESVLLKLVNDNFEGEERQGFVNIIGEWNY